MDIKKTVTELAGKIAQNPGLLSEFRADPATTVKKLIKTDVPDKSLQPIIAGLQDKLKIGDVAGSIIGSGKLSGLGKLLK